MHERDDAWKSIVAGAVAGLAASWVMNRYQEVQSKVVTRVNQSTDSEGERAMEQGRAAALGRERQVSAHSGQQNEDQRPSTVKIAEVISIKVARHHLTEREQRIAEPIVHYAFGTLMGAWYGVLSAVTPVTTAGRGTLYGAAVWLGADEISLTALGLAKNPLEYPISSHLSALSAHVVYGVALDTGRRVLLKTMGAGEEPGGSQIDASRVMEFLTGEDWPSFRRRAQDLKRKAKLAYREAKQRAAA